MPPSQYIYKFIPPLLTFIIIILESSDPSPSLGGVNRCVCQVTSEFPIKDFLLLLFFSRRSFHLTFWKRLCLFHVRLETDSGTFVLGCLRSIL